MPKVVCLAIPKISAVVIFLCFLILSAYPALAKDATPPGLRKEMVKEKIATREAAFKLKLEKFKDQRKATTTQRINQTLSMINQKMTEMMLKHLGVMTNILERLEDKVETSAEITQAREKIASAEAAIKDQADNDYTVIVNSETTVKADAKTARDQLHTDLQAVRNLVIEAKQSVANAIRRANAN